MGIIWDMDSKPGEVQTGIAIDEGSNQLVTIERQDCTDVLERNKKFKNSGMDGYTPSRDMRHAASIPNIILDKWLKEEGIRWWDSADTPKLMAKLDDPEWAHLRTSAGHLGKKPFRIFSKASTSSNKFVAEWGFDE